MALTSMPYLTIQELDANGNPYNGAKLFFYAAGTTTKQDTYADANGNSANTNPVVLDSAGRATVFFQPLTYDVVLAPSTDSDPPVSPIWSRLGITAIPISSANTDVNGIAGEAISAADAVYMSDGSGSKVAGNWYKSDADFTYASTLAAQIGMAQNAIASGSSGSIRTGGRITGLSGLTAGTLYYISATAGALTSSAPANAMPIAVADSTTSVLLQPPTPLASTTVSGLMSIGSQTIGGAKLFFPGPSYTPGTLAAGSLDALIQGVVYKNSTIANSSTGGGVDAFSLSIPGNTLSADGKSIRLTAWLRTAANANNKQFTVSYGGSQIFDSTVLTGSGVTMFLTQIIQRTGASAQRTTGSLAISTSVTATATPAKDNTAAQILKLTLSTATSNADLIFDGCFVEIVG